MRDILFKAKRSDNREWTEGFYFCMVHKDARHVHHFIMPIGVDLSFGTTIENIQVEIIPETLCQYTGLIDKNGRKIFEGDIVKVIEDFAEFYVVEWDEDIARYIFTQSGSVMTDFGDIYADDTEVVGNVFDNPESLLETEQQEQEGLRIMAGKIDITKLRASEGVRIDG